MRGGCYLEQKMLGRLVGGGEVTVVLLQRQTVVAASGCFFFFFLLPSAFSAPLLYIFCSSLFNLWWWRFCQWWLGGTMEALVEVQRWLFSSLFCLALSLSFSSLCVFLFFWKLSPSVLFFRLQFFLFLHSARSPLSSRPLSFLFSVSFNSQNLHVVWFSLPPIFYSSLLICLLLLFFYFSRALPPWICRLLLSLSKILPLCHLPSLYL